MPKIDFKFIFIGLGVLVALAAFGAAVFYFLDPTGFRVLFLSEEGEQTWRQAQEEKVAAVIAGGDIAACDKVNYKSSDGLPYDVVCANNVAQNKAEETLDLSWCQRLDGKLLSVADCESDVVILKMRRERDLSFCGALKNPALRGECEFFYWLEEAVAKSDVSLCGRLSSSVSACRDSYWLQAAVVSGAAGFDCSTLSEAVRPDCSAFESALAASAAEDAQGFCGRIDDSRLKNACFSRTQRQ